MEDCTYDGLYIVTWQITALLGTRKLNGPVALLAIAILALEGGEGGSPYRSGLYLLILFVRNITKTPSETQLPNP